MSICVCPKRVYRVYPKNSCGFPLNNGYEQLDGFQVPWTHPPGGRHRYPCIQFSFQQMALGSQHDDHVTWSGLQQREDS